MNSMTEEELTQVLIDAGNTLNGLGPRLDLSKDCPQIVYTETEVKDIERIMSQCFVDLCGVFEGPREQL